ncbi:MAG: trehalose-phosphatase, partial [Solirubrobacterales bacterium]
VRGEDKDVIFGFHWRGAPDEEAAEEAVRAVASRAEEAGFHTQWGRKILEVRPPLELNKGLGVAHLLSETHVDVALYAGDDRTDLDAFDALRAAVMLDIDGTLAPIVRHADDAHVPEPTRLPLIAIAKRYGLVACVSGRRATTARRIVSLGSITYVGNHGAEILRGGRTTAEVEPRIAAWARRVRSFGEGELRGEELHRLRVRGEDKDVIFGFHWRGAPDEEAAEEAVRAVASRAEEAGFHTHWGRKILEVRPPLELNKGLGVAHLLSETHVDVALYAGDDRTDLDAFDALRAAVAEGTLREAICIGVTSDETPPELEGSADLLVKGPLGVRTVLEVLAGSA